MELNYLWDTNSVIYYLQEQFTPYANDLMDSIVRINQPAISVITAMETLSWRSANEADLVLMNDFIGDCVIYQLDDPVQVATVSIRKTYKIKLPDAIIAATAIVHNKILITRNIADFAKIPTVKLLNLFAE